jgi:hypothetical protein
MSVSEKQLEANRQNAQKSTDPAHCRSLLNKAKWLCKIPDTTPRSVMVQPHGWPRSALAPDICLAVKQSHSPDIVQQLMGAIAGFPNRCETNPIQVPDGHPGLPHSERAHEPVCRARKALKSLP